MIITSAVKERTFNILDITEKEMLVLRTLLKQDDVMIEEMLFKDKNYWDHLLNAAEALTLGIEVREKIFKQLERLW